MMKRLCLLLLLLICFCSSSVFSQEADKRVHILQLLDNNHTVEAGDLLQRQLQEFSDKKNTDSLIAYLVLVGRVAAKTKNNDYADIRLTEYASHIKKINGHPDLAARVLLKWAEFYSLDGRNDKAYKKLSPARVDPELFEAASDNTKISIERTLGEYARRTANIDLARSHYLAAVSLMKQRANPDRELLYQTYSSLGIVSWYASRLDTAAYYFNQAIEVVQKVDSTALNQFYRPAMLRNNLAGVYTLQGKTGQAIQVMESCIDLFRKFLSSEGFPEEKKKAFATQFEAVDNLAGAYKELGDYAKTEQLLLYAYTQKQQHLNADNPAIFISQILLGQLYYARSDYKKAKDYLTTAINSIGLSGADYLFWNADARRTLALLYDQQQQDADARRYFNQADSLYALASDGSYDNTYLEFLQEYADFKARKGECKAALASAIRTLRYVTVAGNETSLLPVYQLKNLAALSLRCGEHNQSLDYAQRAAVAIDRFVNKSTNLADSIKTEGEKAKILLIKVKAVYAITADKTPSVLKGFLNELQIASGIIDRKKSILTDQRDILNAIEDYKNVSDFIKKLNFEIYQKSGDTQYLNRAVHVHEAGLYTRLRSRMEYQQSLQFAQLPNAVQQEEKALKERVLASVKQVPEGKGVVSYREALNEWAAFLSRLKSTQPEYYNMRYANNYYRLDELGKTLAGDITVLRYIYSDENLFVLVITNQQQVLVPLKATGVTEMVNRIQDFTENEKNTTAVSHQLYNQLWRPIEKLITTSRVVIIPDAVLHHLSFDMLSTEPVEKYSDLVAKCLLNKYALSYHYSLSALQAPVGRQTMKANFVAFTPVFSDKEKQKYRLVADSLHLDRDYLSLLPLPFTEKLARRMQEKFGGMLYSEEGSTSGAFRSQAGQHRIIHIGTHAEANNEFPEYSRLIFVKGDSLHTENSVYLYDLYSCNLTANLAVLTACETARSGYQDGEGMVSMAHAFNYAGSESILAGMWKIDEQASTMITEFFYNNLENGMSRDVALQQAKLSYLRNAEGRLLSPQYWAGLTMIGNANPVIFPRKQAGWYFFGTVVLLLVLGGAFYIKQKVR